MAEVSLEDRLGWAQREVRLYRIALAASLLMLVAGGAAWLRRDRAEREAEQARHAEETRRAEETRQQTEAALKRAEALMKEARWADAEVALAEASGRLGDDGPADLHERAERMRRDLDLLNQLLGLRQPAERSAARPKP